MEYYWKCQYNDGSVVSRKKGLKYKDIDRDRLSKFILCSSDNKEVLVFEVGGNRRLILRTRTAIEMNQVTQTIWICGYQETINGENRQTLFFVYPNGTIEATNGFDENHKWHYPVNLLPEEQ
jgi:predicted proteasome-type protease